MKPVAIEVENLSVRYGDFSALEDITFSVEESCFVAVIGPNGSGKSTLLNVIVGALQPSTGTARLFEKRPQEVRADEIGYLPQLKTLDRSFPAVALELVVSGLRHSWPWRIRSNERSLALEAMARTGVADVANRPVAALSGGELQRAYLARSLVRRPKLLVLDEPAAGMDIRGEADMYHLLEEYREETGATILMVTHDWEGARAHATHALLINRGLAGFGPASEIGDEARLLELFGHKGHIHATHGEHGDV